jgi:hypothetical protein
LNGISEIDLTAKFSPPFPLKQILFTNVNFKLNTTFCSYPKVAISKHFNVNQAQTLIEAQSLI